MPCRPTALSRVARQRKIAANRYNKTFLPRIAIVTEIAQSISDTTSPINWFARITLSCLLTKLTVKLTNII